MTSYSVPCTIRATINDHFQFLELHIAKEYAPAFVIGLRGLQTENLEALYLKDNRQSAVILGGSGVTFTLKIEKGSTAYFVEENLDEMEHFTLARMFGKNKGTHSMSLQLQGEKNLQLGFTLWVGDKTVK